MRLNTHKNIEEARTESMNSALDRHTDGKKCPSCWCENKPNDERETTTPLTLTIDFNKYSNEKIGKLRSFVKKFKGKNLNSGDIGGNQEIYNE